MCLMVMGASFIAIIFYVIVIFAYYVCISTIRSLAEERIGANKFAATIFSIFFTPICGILYLLLFPRKN